MLEVAGIEERIAGCVAVQLGPRDVPARLGEDTIDDAQHTLDCAFAILDERSVRAGRTQADQQSPVVRNQSASLACLNADRDDVLDFLDRHVKARART